MEKVWGKGLVKQQVLKMGFRHAAYCYYFLTGKISELWEVCKSNPRQI